MLAHGVIEHLRSNWAFPLVPVRKKYSSLRLGLDYHKLNGLSKVDPYPMPHVDKLIDGVGQSPFITTLDLTKGYWQIPVAEMDGEKIGKKKANKRMPRQRQKGIQPHPYIFVPLK